ncbi:DUF2599 domain-containing protein, partial [Kytococcus schroeteri]|uniref:DUF2599 domain-containing protein n=1 Tax=Kytococcus schroeteri TaxID=138300 RepID=UPI0011817CC3
EGVEVLRSCPGPRPLPPSTHAQLRRAVNAFVTPWGRAWTGRATFGYHRDEVRSQLGGRAGWYTGTIREQHYCHVFFGGPTHWEPDYNLESWRRYVSWWRQAQNKCNP